MSVLFIGSLELPDQSANATRIINLAKLFNSCGKKVFLMGTRFHSEVILQGKYEGFNYSHVDATNYLSISKIKRMKYLEKLWINTLEKFWEKEHFDIIVVSDFINQNNSFIIKFARKRNVAIVYNSVEWYQKNNEVFVGIGGKVKFLYNRYNLIVQHVKMKNIIGISSLLTNYYKSKKCNSIRIPTIVDKNKYLFTRETKNKKVIISYAGAPARKDYITNAIKALILLNFEEKKKIELHLYGVNIEQLEILGISKKTICELEEILFLHGRIPHSEIQNKIASSDFTILLRPNLRYANAGFPTKVGESMMCGTPVIANHTSDLALYIKDGETGVVVKDESVDSCVNGFRKVLKMRDEEKKKMRILARLEAERSFYYLSYKEEFEKFLKGLKR